ncbi:YciC family protein [Pseudomonas xantholysinigenes]|uniref:Uncharacterized protein n=1 Tax=Pseudomonas xantholysinigenes TaxID=2745490 RepID=A0A9E6PYA3_9PSED|nr:YciC family protein [Pseudomonas xantholysinigenes]QXI39117.1 hypothetical protein HU772_003210 [Pseudomonas xantholysinigenes]
MNPLSVLRDSLYFFRRHLASILQLCLPLVVLEALLTQLLDRQLGEQAAPAFGMLVSLLFYPLYTAALILYLDTRSNGQAIAKRDLFARALQLWPRLALLVVICTLLISAGLLLFIFPGVWIMVNLVFAEYLLVLRGLPVIEAMRTSARMTTGHFLRIMICMLAVLAPLWLIEGLLISAFPEPQPGVRLAVDSFNGFLQLFATVVLYRLFMLRESEAGA